MSNAEVWSLVALLIAPMIAMQLLQIAPKSFWRGLAERNSGWAHFLWGYSHMFGPMSKPGEPPATRDPQFHDTNPPYKA